MAHLTAKIVDSEVHLKIGGIDVDENDVMDMLYESLIMLQHKRISDALDAIADELKSVRTMSRLSWPLSNEAFARLTEARECLDAFQTAYPGVSADD